LQEASTDISVYGARATQLAKTVLSHAQKDCAQLIQIGQLSHALAGSA